MGVFLKSALQRQRDDVEFIVVEKGSGYFQPQQKSFYTYLPISGSCEYHRSFCMNQGAAIAQGSYLIFHDGDIPLPKNFWEKMDEGALHGWSYFANYRRMIHLVEPVTHTVIEQPEKALYGYYFLDTDPARIRVHGQEGMFGGSTTVARPLFERVGGFDKSIKGWGGEDTELDIRLRHSNGGLVGIVQQDLIHLYHPQIDPWKENPFIKQNHSIIIKTMQDPDRAIEKLLRARKEDG